MQSEIDLKQLAVDRGSVATLPRSGGQWLSRYVIPMALLIACAAVVTWSAWDLIDPPREVTVQLVVVTRSKAEPAGTRLFEASGWVEPRPTPVHVPALASGVVEKLLVVDDQLVAKGEPIAELVKDDANLRLAAAEADQKLRQAELEDAQAAHAAAVTRFEKPVHLEAPLRQAEAELARVNTQLTNLPFEIRQAEAEQEFAQRNYDGKLAAKDALVGRIVEKAEADLAAAIAVVEGLRMRQASWEAERDAVASRCKALQALLDMLPDELQARDQAAARVKAAQARVRQAEVVVDEARLELSRMTIYAPVSGRVYHLLGHPGARVGGPNNPGGHNSSSVITMYQPEKLQVRVDVRFDDVPDVQLGQDVRINNPSLADPIMGRVLYISSEADIQKNTLEVKVELPHAPDFFKPEMLVDASFLAMEQAESAAPSEEERIYVPGNLVQGKGGGAAFVWLADQSEGRVRKVSVTLGATTSDGMVEIQNGLNRTSRILDSGFDGLADGDRIRVLGDSTSDPSSNP